jgi:hypothetical protein
MTDLTRFTYLINQCLKFLWTRDQQEEIQKLGNALVKENERLRAANRWIPVSERLPTIEETHNDDALFIWNGEIVRACFNPYGPFKNGNVEDKSFYTQDENGYDYQLHFVTHWKLIPGPRKEGEK